MIEKFLGNMKKYQLLLPGDSLVLGVSGGIDSMALLHIMISLKEAFQLKIQVAHLNHGVRGLESDRDALFVSEFARSRNLEYFEKSVNMNEYAEENGLSKEEAGRVLRYSFFEEVREHCSAEKIVVAHNMNDQVETVLFRIMRGTGVEGLRGMSFKTGRIIRPMLNISRFEIEAYIQKFSIPYREDLTNKSTEYTRNRIRLELIPYIERNFNPKFSEAIYRLSKNAEESNFLTHLGGYEHYLRMVEEKDEEWTIQRGLFTTSHEAIRHYILRHMMSGCSLSSLVDYQKIQLIDRFIGIAESGKSMDLGEGWCLLAEVDIVSLTKKSQNSSFEFEISSVDDAEVEIGSYRIQLQKIKKTDENYYKTGRYTKYFAWEKISFPLKIRNRRIGDRIYPYGMQGSKLLSDLYTDEKISRTERNLIPLLVCGKDILWAIGLRDDRRYCVEDSTEEILKVIVTTVSDESDVEER